MRSSDVMMDSLQKAHARLECVRDRQNAMDRVRAAYELLELEEIDGLEEGPGVLGDLRRKAEVPSHMSAREFIAKMGWGR